MIETLPVVNSCSECLSSVDRTHKFCYNCGNPLLLGDGTLLLDGTRSDCNINLIVDLQNTDPKPEPEYVTWFTTQHREACRTAAFSPDGKFLATGSKDYSIKILDITKIKECFLEKNDI
ncbi:cleavage stimulation factor, 3' pre-RNA, subunit 1, partial [Clydaea vesicula]